MNSDIFDEFPEHPEDPEETDKPRKRKVNKDNWKKNDNKRQKYCAKAEKQPTLSCEHSSHFCSAKKLHDAFWHHKNAISQKSFLMGYIDVKKPQRQRPGQGQTQRSNKKISSTFRVPTEKGTVKVCRRTFLSILNVGRRKVEKAASDKFNFLYTVPETRGGARHCNIVMSRKAKIIAHIKKFKFVAFIMAAKRLRCENIFQVS